MKCNDCKNKILVCEDCGKPLYPNQWQNPYPFCPVTPSPIYCTASGENKHLCSGTANTDARTSKN